MNATVHNTDCRIYSRQEWLIRWCDKSTDCRMCDKSTDCRMYSRQEWLFRWCDKSCRISVRSGNIWLLRNNNHQGKQPITYASTPLPATALYPSLGTELQKPSQKKPMHLLPWSQMARDVLAHTPFVSCQHLTEGVYSRSRIHPSIWYTRSLTAGKAVAKLAAPHQLCSVGANHPSWHWLSVALPKIHLKQINSLFPWC